MMLKGLLEQIYHDWIINRDIQITVNETRFVQYDASTILRNCSIVFHYSSLYEHRQPTWLGYSLSTSAGALQFLRWMRVVAVGTGHPLYTDNLCCLDTLRDGHLSGNCCVIHGYSSCSFSTDL